MTLDCSHDLCLPFKWLVFERSRCEWTVWNHRRWFGALRRLIARYETTGEITINRGVKQGDPLSHVLCNIAMDPLFCLVEKSGPYRLEDGTAVGVAGYADDTLVVSGNRDDSQLNVDLVSEFCRAAKLKLRIRLDRL